MRHALRFPAVLLGAFTVSGCCGPCARWIVSGATSGSPAPPPPPGASGSSEPSPGGARNSGESPGNTAAGSSRTSMVKHPIFPGRRRYVEYRTYFKLGAERLPQLPDLQGVFDSMPRESRPHPTGGLVVCRVQVKGRFDDFRGADTAGSLSVGGRSYSFYGPEDTDLAYFSVPRAPWTAGEKLTLSVWDRDVTTNEAIDTVSGTIGTAPLSLSAHNMDVDCRASPSEAVEETTRALVKRAAAAASKARAAKPTPREREWGYGISGISDAWGAVDEMAAHVGWDDPRVRSAGQEIEKIEADWTSSATQSVAAEVAKLPPLSQKSRVHLAEVDATVESLWCDAPKVSALLPGSKAFFADTDKNAPCILEIRGTRTSPQDSLFLFPESAVQGSLVFADGSEIGLTDVELVDAKGQRPEDFQWTPKSGESYTVRFLPSANVAIGSHPGAGPEKSLGPAKLLRFDSKQPNGAPAFVRLDG